MLAETFGASGTAQAFFGGLWWVVGIYLLMIFISMLMGYKVQADGIAIFIIVGLLTITAYSLFILDDQIPQVILLFIFIYVASAFYLWFRK